jgi:hypothetical protein
LLFYLLFQFLSIADRCLESSNVLLCSINSKVPKYWELLQWKRFSNWFKGWDKWE